jgi:hypothetical protein
MWTKLTSDTPPGIYVYRRSTNPDDWQIIVIRANGDITFKFGHHPTLYLYIPDDAEIADPKTVLTLIE